MTEGILRPLGVKSFELEASLSDSSLESESDSFEFAFFSSASSLISVSSSSYLSGDELWSEFSLSSLSDNDLSNEPHQISTGDENEVNAIPSTISHALVSETHTVSKKLKRGSTESKSSRKRNNSHKECDDINKSKEPFCDICGEVFNSQATLDVHKLNHLTTKAYVCDVCQHVSKNSQDYALHYQTHDQNNVVLSSTLTKKEKVHTMPFKCETCGKAFRFASSYKRHADRHTLQHICNICNASFPTQLLCHQHKLTHARKTLHKCEVCGKVCQRPHQLTIHMQVHESQKNYRCDECDTQYCYKTSLMRHMLKYHSPNSPKFQCPICGELFKNKKTLNGHEILHTAKKLIECPDCNQTFKYRSSFHRHRVIHQGAKPFRCSTCGKLYRTESDLKTHKSQHFTNDEFVCKVCDKSFAFESYLNMHMLTHGQSNKDIDIYISD